MIEITAKLTSALASRYKLERHIGEGGMATVYLATDLKHERKVAVKVLRPELAAILGGERFLQEIKVTAGLQHPHILPLHDSGEADGFLYYVMPFIEGESLREKMKREKQLGVDETIEIAKAVASAMDYAHEQGIVHRDIKPENILMQRGQALVADFGIALAVSAAGGTRLTETGLSLGTPHYMSPEQATGDRELDARSDLYSLGAMVYEMLTGEPPHMGNSVQAIIAKILSDTPPPITRARELVPANVDAAVHRAIAKSPADRFATAGQFADALTNPAFTLPTTAVTTKGGKRPGRGLWDRLGPIAAGLAVAFLALALWAMRRPDVSRPIMRVAVGFPEGERFAGSGSFDISRDGSVMVYEGVGESGVTQLWVRRWDALSGAPIPGTDGQDNPAISPDGSQVAFILGGAIRVVPLQGGVSRTVAADSARCCMRWSPEGDWLYFNNPQLGLSRTRPGGGPIEVVTRVDTLAGETFHLWPDVAPGGDVAVFVALRTAGEPQVMAVDARTGVVKAVSAGQFPRLTRGHVLFTTPDGTTLMAARFDLGRLELTGTAAPVAEGLRRPVAGGWNFYAASQTGSLIYSVGDPIASTFEVVFVNRDGRATSVDPEWIVNPGDNNRGLALSPDGSRLAVTILDESNYDIWVKQLPDGPASRLTFNEGWDVRPRWTPDGESVTFLSIRTGVGTNANVFTRRATGTGSAELLVDHELPLWEAQYSVDGEWLLLRTGGTSTIAGGRDVWGLRPGTDSVPLPIVVTDFDEKAIALSPNGRWLAYESNETGRNEIYVRPFPDVEQGKWQVSTAGGVMPVWAHSGRELFYINGDNEMVVARIDTEPAFAVGGRSILFPLGRDILFRQAEQYALFDITPDDQQFVMMRGVDLQSTEPELILVQNWEEDLSRRRGR